MATNTPKYVTEQSSQRDRDREYATEIITQRLVDARAQYEHDIMVINGHLTVSSYPTTQIQADPTVAQYAYGDETL